MKCWVCGEAATKTRHVNAYNTFENGVSSFLEPINPNPYCRSYCDKCYKLVAEEEHAEDEEYIRLKKRRMFRSACDLLEKQHTDMYKYREAIDVVKEHIEKNPDKYDSSYEVLAAIVLVQNRIRCKMQYKVGRYQVDFLIPDWYVVLEIDGDRHKYKKQSDRERDFRIIKTLGLHWEIIRINTDLLDTNAKALPTAIRKILQKREKEIEINTVN